MLRSSAGAFDLTSVLVGAVAVAIMAGGVLAAVFGVIPFAQDHAAKQRLEAVGTGQGITKVQRGRFQNLASLKDTGIAVTAGLGTITHADGSCYVAASRSDSGRAFLTTSNAPTPIEVSGPVDTGCVARPDLDSMAIEVTGQPFPEIARMTTEWDTSLPNSPWMGPCTTITLPLTGVIDATLDWGDGTVEKFSSEFPSHPYAGTPGPRTIVIEGTFTGWVGQNLPDWSYDCLTAVTEWGDTGTVEAEAAFAFATNLTSMNSPPESITSMRSFFDSTTSLP
ncbi:hypothetical protein DBR22_01860 [Arthrobacter sp. HMWF013]|nr:hypothetical protein DBR22_01860 [Arthrobacter sp. HMWF013]